MAKHTTRIKSKSVKNAFIEEHITKHIIIIRNS